MAVKKSDNYRDKKQLKKQRNTKNKAKIKGDNLIRTFSQR